MWIILSDVFLSIVHKDCAPDELLVRARRPGDIEKVFPGAKVKESFGTDYRYRAKVMRSAIAAAMAEQIYAIDYANFKDSIPDDKFHHAAHRIWDAMARLQPGGPYARREDDDGAD